MKTQHAPSAQYIETVDLVRRLRSAEQRAHRARPASPHSRCLEKCITWMHDELTLRANAAERSVA